MPHHVFSGKGIRSKGAARDLRNAWIAVALIPVAFVVATVVGEFAVAALGYPSGGDKSTPTGIRAAVGIPATLLLVAPGVIAGIYGLRARREGEPRGLWPSAIGFAVTAVFLLQTIASLIQSFIQQG
jgi:hypothetical protein